MEMKFVPTSISVVRLRDCDLDDEQVAAILAGLAAPRAADALLELDISANLIESIPAAIGDLTSLRKLDARDGEEKTLFFKARLFLGITAHHQAVRNDSLVVIASSRFRFSEQRTHGLIPFGVPAARRIEVAVDEFTNILRRT